eukprot:9025903-Alexandrium_andersonii.AAC.1
MLIQPSPSTKGSPAAAASAAAARQRGRRDTAQRHVDARGTEAREAQRLIHGRPCELLASLSLIHI